MTPTVRDYMTAADRHEILGMAAKIQWHIIMCVPWSPIREVMRLEQVSRILGRHAGEW
jgi:hypothetical protein